MDRTIWALFALCGMHDANGNGFLAIMTLTFQLLLAFVAMKDQSLHPLTAWWWAFRISTTCKVHQCFVVIMALKVKKKSTKNIAEEVFMGGQKSPFAPFITISILSVVSHHDHQQWANISTGGGVVKTRVISNKTDNLISNRAWEDTPNSCFESGVQQPHQPISRHL